MKTVVIFGAGASRSAGAPLMFDFLDKADQFRRAGLEEPYASAFDRVFIALSGLQPVHAKAFLDSDNIETFFGAVEMGILLGTFPGYAPADLPLLRTALIQVIVKTLEASILFESSSEGLIPPQPWGPFGHALREMAGHNPQRLNDWTFLTFNYDTLLELTLEVFGLPYDYGLVGDVPTGALPVLKLHGSINWAFCRKCEKVLPQPLGRWVGRQKGMPPRYSLPIGSDIARCHHVDCTQAFQDPPVLVPPTWDKGKYHSQIREVWQLAARKLTTAENVVLVGYSAPESDAFFRFLYALGTAGPTRLKNLSVIDPDETGDVERRIRAMTGRGVEKRLSFPKNGAGRWEDSFRIVLSLLAQ